MKRYETRGMSNVLILIKGNFMSYFDWDAYISRAKYSEINKNIFDSVSCLNTVPFVPTMVSPCKKFIYFRSLDVDERLDDFDGLGKVLEWFICDYDLYNYQLSRGARLKLDYEILWGYLADNNQLPEKFYGLSLFEMACSTLKEDN